MVTAPYSFNSRDALPQLARAGFATAIIDGLFSSILSVAAYGSTVTRLFQGVAATLVGNSAFNGGVRTTVLGVLMHCGVAFGWSSVFIFVVMRSAWIRRATASWTGVLAIALAYGPAIWLVMSLVVIPLLLQRPPAVSIRWWIQLIGHFPFVGIPIVAFAGRRTTRSGDEAATKPSAA